MLLTHGTSLKPRNFLTICVFCNGCIKSVGNDPDLIKEAFESNKCPVIPGLVVYQCDTCSQFYWWSEEPNSSASRVKLQAAHLFKLAIQAGVPIEGDLHMFDFVDVEAERKVSVDCGDVSTGAAPSDALKWIQRRELRHPFSLESAYSALKPISLIQPETVVAVDEQTSLINEELLPFTNVTNDFVGTLDYIFYEPHHWQLKSRLHVPTSFREMNITGVNKGHLIPSASWPSDHLAIGAQIQTISPSPIAQHLQQQQPIRTTSTINAEKHTVKKQDSLTTQGAPKPLSNSQNATDQTNTTTPQFPANPTKVVFSPETQQHSRVDCACGCVPKNMLSLFEMAELRKQFREKQKAEKLAAAARVDG
eukprot:CAMPEP_0171299262 /NCGR_PEP_ID=MMETSP0816-20121228/8075_1 /TAXON_ID=420281 /ORGANISM="Proboscia inermis, Strain CCAP1064/1" /LENGTH=363 /DNA_ID=CAMNT_0011774925 /DNA_START=164 /DNA_END=1255 /DNA_ORIENTATION=+